MISNSTLVGVRSVLLPFASTWSYPAAAAGPAQNSWHMAVAQLYLVAWQRARADAARAEFRRAATICIN